MQNRFVNTCWNHFWTPFRPDICVVFGDRGESLVTAIVATTLGVPIAHIQGGDVSGSTDEQVSSL